MQDHILEVICNNNQEYCKWLLAWLARIVQDPGGDRSHAAVVLKGEKGTGKGIFTKYFGKIFGNHYKYLSNQNHLTGKFNAHLKDALVVFADESFWADAKSDESVLKAMITEDTIPIEPKGKDVFEVKNHINLIMASNNEWVVPATLDERRFFVLEVSSNHIQDRDYFIPLIEQMENGGVAAMMFDLLELDISGIDLKNPPRTEALIEQIKQSMKPHEKWWYDRLIDGSLFNDFSEKMVLRKTVQDDYLAYCKSIETKSIRLSEDALGTAIRKMCPSVKDKRETQPNAEGKRLYNYILPPLETARKEFEKKIKFPVTWD